MTARSVAAGLCSFPARALSLTVCFLLGGCSSPGFLQAKYKPDNVFYWNQTLPPTLQRVAILPLTADRGCDYTVDRCALEEVLYSELVKTKRFEVVRMTPEVLRSETGRSSWRAEDPLPPGFLGRIRQATGCDAVIFSEVTLFRGFTPLAIGWRMRLVEAPSGRTLWAVDETFDARDRRILAAASRHEPASPYMADGWRARNSPREFALFSTSRLVATLPER